MQHGQGLYNKQRSQMAVRQHSQAKQTANQTPHLTGRKNFNNQKGQHMNFNNKVDFQNLYVAAIDNRNHSFYQNQIHLDTYGNTQFSQFSTNTNTLKLKRPQDFKNYTSDSMRSQKTQDYDFASQVVQPQKDIPMVLKNLEMYETQLKN